MSFPGESIISAGVGGALSYAGARAANKANKQIAREQMDFQERMSNTSYQRQIQDIKAAGLNPNLVYGSGGASTPPGASATMQNELAPAVNSAIEARRSSAELHNLEEQNKNLRAQGQKLNAETTLTEIMSMLEKSKIPAAKTVEEFDKTQIGQIAVKAKRTLESVHSASSLINLITKGLFRRK